MGAGSTCPPSSRGWGGGHRRHLNPSIDLCTQFSYLGVSATAGMSDWYERMPRTPIRDGFRHPPATPTTVARTTTAWPPPDQGSQEKCSAGACPQLGAGWGAQTTPEPFHQPMHPIFIPWCAGDSRHERLVRTHAPDSDPGWIPAPAGDTNHRRPNNDSPGSQEKCRAGACPQPGGGAGAQTTPEPFHQPMHPIFKPWCAGDSRHERLVRDTHGPGLRSGIFRRRPATPTTVPNNDSPGSKREM